MSRYAAFLRGMNLGNRRITNDELRSHFVALGFSDVGTFLASGNVVFNAEAESPLEIEGRIEEGLAEALGYEVPTFVRTAEAVREIAAVEPFDSGIVQASKGSPQVVLLASFPDDSARQVVLDLATEDDRLAFGDRDLYWLPQNGVSGTGLDWKRLEEMVGTTTVRTRRTLERLVAKFF